MIGMPILPVRGEDDTRLPQPDSLPSLWPAAPHSPVNPRSGRPRQLRAARPNMTEAAASFLPPKLWIAVGAHLRLRQVANPDPNAGIRMLNNRTAHPDLRIIRMRAKNKNIYLFIHAEPSLRFVLMHELAPREVSAHHRLDQQLCYVGDIRGDGYALYVAQTKKSNNIGLVRLRHKRVAQKNNQVKLILSDESSNLLISPKQQDMNR